jgi:hypothetical protein
VQACLLIVTVAGRESRSEPKNPLCFRFLLV